MSDKTILLLQQDINSLTIGASDAVLYGRAADADWLRQIAVATRASVQAQVEMLRQQHEIIRLLEQLQRGRETTR
jgi:ABC-type cobalamin/Fe3+-siderophores transport system ATPase subunit